MLNRLDSLADGLLRYNRNYDSYWRNGSRWSNDTQSQIYSGPSPFSESETQAFRDFALKHKFALAYSLHSGTNATYFPSNPRNDWIEATLYQQMVQDYSKILPRSYTCIYRNPVNSHRQLASVLTGSWETWMYYERGTLVPMTFEIYGNATSHAEESEIPIVNNSTHLITEWKEIYSYFNPEAQFINNLWNDVSPTFDYLLEMTQRLEIDANIRSGGPSHGDELVIEFNYRNLRPINLKPSEDRSVRTEKWARGGASDCSLERSRCSNASGNFPGQNNCSICVRSFMWGSSGAL